MKYICTSIILSLFITISSVNAEESVANDIINQKMQAAKELYKSRKNSSALLRAIELWQQVVKIDPKNDIALTKLTIASVWHGMHADKNQQQIYEQGIKWGEKAIKINPKNVEARYWKTANMGSLGKKRGLLQSLFILKPMEKELKKIIEIDAKYWRAYMLLGMLYREAPGWPISFGDKKEAIKNLKKAVKLMPNAPRALNELAKGYLAIDEKEQAKQLFKKSIKAPLEKDFELESLKDQQEAKQLLNKL